MRNAFHIVCFLLAFPAVGEAQLLSDYRRFATGDSIRMYNGELQVLENRITGNLAMRRLAPDHYRVAFFNELGLTYFDLAITPGRKLVTYSIIPQLDKGILTGMLRNDLLTLFLIGSNETGVAEGDAVIFRKNRFIVSQNPDVQHIKYKNGKVAVTIYAQDVQRFTIGHKAFPLKMDFSRLSSTR